MREILEQDKIWVQILIMSHSNCLTVARRFNHSDMPPHLRAMLSCAKGLGRLALSLLPCPTTPGLETAESSQKGSCTGAFIPRSCERFNLGVSLQATEGANVLRLSEPLP